MVIVPPSQACRKQNKQRTNECLIETNNLRNSSHSADCRPGQDVKLTLLPRGGLKKEAEKTPRTHPPHFLVCHRQKGKGPSLGIPDNLGGKIFEVASACTIVGIDVSTTTRSTRHLASLDLRWATRPLVSLVGKILPPSRI